MINLTQDISRSEARRLAEATGTDELCASLLIARGYSDENKARRFLYGSLKDLTEPSAYCGMEAAVTEIRETMGRGGKIVFYGDYDCDGIGAIAILTRAFRDKNVRTEYYIPARADEGYGLNIDAIYRIKREMNADLLVTVDCGISAYGEVAAAKEVGLKILVTDHHRPGEKLPDCTVVNPCLNPELTQLCGAGVAFMLVRSLFGDDFAFEYLDICALSTVADVVPLTGDNRLLVKYGLEQIRRGKGKTGVKALMAQAGVSAGEIASSDIAFKLAPRLNASGRLSTAHSSVKLLTTDDITEAAFLAEELSLQNSERQEIGKAIVSSAMETLKKYDLGKYRVIVLYGEEWQEGVNGIAAARLTEYFHLPTILFTKNGEGLLKGSARSIAGVNIFEAISYCRSLTVSFGGHAMAAGLSLKEENFDKFRDMLNEFVSRLPEETFRRELSCDAVVSVEAFSESNRKYLRLLEPFGYKNSTPVFFDDAPKIRFSVMKEKHLKARAGMGEAVCFGKASLLPAYESARRRGFTYTAEKNCFNGRERLQFRIRNLFYENFQIPDEVLFLRFAEFSVNCKHSVNQLERATKTGSVNTLHVFFDGGEYRNFLAENAGVSSLFASCDEFLRGDVAVLSPDMDFPFLYYGTIVLHGDLSSDIEGFFKAMGAVSESGKKVAHPEFDLEEMRDAYRALRRFSAAGNDIKSLRGTANSLSLFDYAAPSEKFALYFYIMLDVGLLKRQNGDILVINDKKTDLNESSLYRYINGKRA